MKCGFARIGQILLGYARLAKNGRPPNGTTYIVGRVVLQFAYTKIGIIPPNCVNPVRNKKPRNGMRQPVPTVAPLCAFTEIGTILLSYARVVSKSRLISGMRLVAKFAMRVFERAVTGTSLPGIVKSAAISVPRDHSRAISAVSPQNLQLVSS
jgi:hypothetical protein